MVGDAISHAVLPGIVLAYLFAGNRNTLIMLLGATILGVITTVLIEFFHKKAKLQTDASIGVTFTWLFAFGVILISIFAGQVDIDQDCVLYGEIAYVPLDLIITESGKIIGPRALLISSMILVLVIALIFFTFKELKLTTFDPAFAAAIGISTVTWNYVLMGAVSLVTVSSFESVGAILVVAFLVAPPATAYLLTKSLNKMLLITSIIGVAVAVSGYYLAVWLDGSIAGAMATMAGVIFALTFVSSPETRISIRKRV